MKIKIIALAFLCMLMLVGCTDDSSSEKSKTTSTTPTTTTAHEDISFEATVIDVTSERYVHFVDIDADLDGSGQKVGKARLDYDIDSVDVSDGIKNGDKVKITTNGEIGLGESVPPVVFGIKKIEKIGEGKDISFEATVIKADDGHVGLIESDYVIDSANGKIGKARLEYDDSVEVDSDIKEWDKIKITVWGDVIGMKESYPPIIFDIKSIEKIGESKDISFEATVIKADDGYITLVDAELSYGNGEKVGESRLECDDSVEIPSDIEEGDKLKVTVGQDFSIIETGPPIITNIKSIEKIS